MDCFCHRDERCPTNGGRENGKKEFGTEVHCPGGVPIFCGWTHWSCWWCGERCDRPDSLRECVVGIVWELRCRYRRVGDKLRFKFRRWRKSRN